MLTLCGGGGVGVVVVLVVVGPCVDAGCLKRPALTSHVCKAAVLLVKSHVNCWEYTRALKMCTQLNS